MADTSDALQKYISAQNSIADLTKRAQEQGKNIADVTNTVKGLNVNYANLAGDVNSTKVDVKGLQTTIGTANGDIAQLKLDAQNLQTMLAGKVDNTTYTNFVNLTNQALNARLTASDLNGYAKTADVQATANGLRVDLNSVTDRMNNLKVGGRNYLRDSDKSIFGWAQDLGTMPNEVLDQLAGKTITVSCDVEWSNYEHDSAIQNRLGFELGVRGSDGKDYWLGVWKNPTTASGKQRVYTTYTFPEGVTYTVQNNKQNGYVSINGQGKVSHVKVEIGNKATDWTPAPEDFTNDITQLSARITANSQQFSSYYTKSETDSKADFAKNDAVNAIKSDGNWQGLNNILTNSGFLQTADGFLQKVQQTTVPMFNGGGVNLLLNTQSFDENWTWDNIEHSFANGVLTLSDTNSGYSRTLQSVAGGGTTGRTFSLSFNARINDDCDSQFVQVKAGPYDAPKSIAVTGKNSQSYKIEGWKWTGTSANFSLYVIGGKIDISNLKLEYGSVATPYSPNPADLATQSAFSELSQSLEGLRSTVGSNYGSLQSQISQSSSTLRTELTDKINGIDNKTTSTADSLNSVIGRVGSLENLTNFQVINNAINANDYTNAGNYFIQSTANTNVPGTNWCYLKVERVNDGRIVQTWQADNDPTLRFVRTKIGDSWTNWQRAASYSEYSELNRTVQGLQSTVSSHYSTLTNQITQTSKTTRNEITDKVNGLQNQITANANSFNIKISNLNGGGVNLLTNSKNMHSGWSVDGTSVYPFDNYLAVRSVNGNQRIIRNPTEDTKGKMLSVSFDAEVPDDSRNKDVQLFVGPFQAALKVTITGNTFKRYKIENWKWNGPNSAFSIQFKNAGDKINIKNIKLEYGLAATPWSPAPEDTDQAFTELNATINGLQSTVSGNYGDLQSQINQTATTLRGEVTDKVNGLQGQITTQANNINLMLGTAGDLSNICRNPTFDNHDGWTDNVHVESNWPEIPTKYCGVLFTRDGYYGKEFTVVPGDRYYTSVFANNQNDVDFVLGLHFKMKDGSDQWLSGSRIGARECRQSLGSITVPDNAVTAKIWASIQKFDNFGFTRFTNVIVKKNDTLAQINMSAGTTLIQNDKIYMDASSTIFSGNAFIPSAAITELNADKITTGTLNAANVNIINLNANNITTGTINGQNLKINLNTGEILFQHGKITSILGTLNINVDTGIMSVTDMNGAGVYYSNGEMFLNDGPINSWFSNPTYGGIRRSPFGWKNGSTGIQMYSKNGVSLETSNYNGAFANGSIIDSTSTGAAVEVDSSGSTTINGAGVTSVVGGSQFDTGSMGFKNRAHIWVGSNTTGESGNRIVMDGDFVHIISAYRHTTGDAPNLLVANDGALLRSTSASKYKTNIKRSHSTDYGERLLNLPVATWIDKGQKERYEAGKRHIKPNKYFGMIAEDLADAGLDLLVSRNVDGEIEGIQYERIAPALIPVIKKLKDKVEKLEKIINEQ